MDIIDGLRSEFEHETRSTRKLLERVPDQHFDWKPHPKSMSLGRLASHLIEPLDWVGPTLDQDELVFAPGSYKPWNAKNRKELLEKFDASVKAAIEKMGGRSDAHLMQTWALKSGEKTVFSMPRAAVLRFFILNHQIHHRAQLGVYLRLKDVPVPQVYGPTADEPDMRPQG